MSLKVIWKFETQKNDFINKFIFYETFFFISSRKILKNDAILMNHGSFFQQKDSLQLDGFQFLKIYQLLLNSANYVYKFCFKKLFFNAFSY